MLHKKTVSFQNTTKKMWLKEYIYRILNYLLSTIVSLRELVTWMKKEWEEAGIEVVQRFFCHNHQNTIQPHLSNAARLFSRKMVWKNPSIKYTALVEFIFLIECHIKQMPRNWLTVAYDKVSANTASSVPKTSKFENGHRVVKRF